MAEKLKMKIPGIVNDNISFIASRFPEAIVEVTIDGKTTHKIDFEVLSQELSDSLAEEKQEKYQFLWPGKKSSITVANAPTSSTLRPLLSKSREFAQTKNLYIEGDNLEVLKVIRETYLGKVKAIYIDPPYNTGNDFVYNDSFETKENEYLKSTGEIDELGNRMVLNSSANGRFHSDWLNLIYPRLKVARDLLTDDGAIFISIDDNEQANMVKICNEIFGESNKIAEFIIIRSEGGGMAKQVVKGHDYLFVYAKNSETFRPLGRPKDVRGKIVEKDGEQYWIQEDWLRKEFGKYGNCHYEEILECKGPEKLREIEIGIKKGDYVLIPKENGMHVVGKLRKLSDDSSKFYSVLKHLSADGVHDLEALGLGDYFDYPKPVKLIKEFIRGITLFTKNQEDIILDFFSGSATTAQAVMELNREDGGNRRFILVQLPEPCDADSPAAKAGFQNLCDVGEERVKRAGDMINSALAEKPVDVGFRVFKLDSTNMKDVYYHPNKLHQASLLETVNNVKDGRNSYDLLFQVLLQLGVDLSTTITESKADGYAYFNVGENYLCASFEAELSDDAVKQIAGLKPVYMVFKDGCFVTDSSNINCEQIIKAISPSTELKVL